MSRILLAVFFLYSISLIHATEESKNVPKTEKITISDARDKRQLSNFIDNSNRSIQRRITTNYSPYPSYAYNGGGGVYDKDFSTASSAYPKIQNYGPTYSKQPSQYVRGYVEAPEPIIEIIIKDSNETLPTPEPIKYQPSKKKKEQVQVFYVKYNKDENKGLIIDDPIPALTPSHFNHEESEEEEDIEQIPYTPSTISPPVRSTTLRTIIKPDSEIYHSNSGIQVTFNTESKHQVGHEFQEHYEESALQPIVTDVHSSSVEHASLTSNGNTDRARAFDIQYNSNNGPNMAGSHTISHNPQNYHRIAGSSSSNLNSLPFLRPTPDQGLLLSYTQNQANRLLQSQSFDNRIKAISSPNQNGQQNHRFPDVHVLNFGLPLNTPPIKFRTQSTNPQHKPIPIPLHHGDKTQQHTSSSVQLQHSNHHQHYTNFNQFRLKQQPITIHQSSQFQQSFPQPIRILNQNVAEPTNHRLVPSTIQPFIKSSSHTSEPNRNVNLSPSPQDNNKNFFQQKGVHFGQSTSSNIQPQLHSSGNSQEFNRFVSGAELVESLPKFEQHITETIPLSEINKPFSPFRHLTSVQSTGIRIDTAPLLSQQTKKSIFIQGQQQAQQQNHIHEEKPLHSPIEHTKLLKPEQKLIFNQEQTYSNSISPQIVLPVNYQTKNSQRQDQKTFNSVSSSSNYPTPVFHEKLILGKGVSNLATDVFGELSQSPQNYNEHSSSHIVSHRVPVHDSYTGSFANSITERNFITTNHAPLDTRKLKHSHLPSTTTTTTTTVKPTPKKAPANLPDEVPDDLRQQLLSSGILENADISVLDYDKVGDIPLEALPPEHLANFYGAGGATQISSSNRVLNIVKPNGDSVAGIQYSDDEKIEGKKAKTLPKKHNVDLKVVRFDSSNQKSIADKYIKPDSTVLPSVDINQNYDRYLPLKVNGEQFPIPEVETLLNKKISSVVVLAPVNDGLNSSDNDEDEDIVEDGRYERDVIDSKELKFLGGESLKNLLRKPTKENFKRWLDKEAKTNIEMQSVVLLVVKNETNGQEIYMYDIGTKVVNRLKGELSTAFVNVAESNAEAQEKDNKVTLIDSGIKQTVEKMPTSNSDNEQITIVEANSRHQNQPIYRRKIETKIKTDNDSTQNQ
ncbi:uncharacterized protein LOC116339090 [Contarinia nasturtii]|uniref:uncharacterized protein LOC116339090 n=1 Tax=Contarinia nasturtii TaxID=265458 RepID=UPI0012D43EF6|nr:uncharacterized protein LOC116339090 [Contarinia nasturtii]XP_031620603.1 uncharacterized protein LOC116339090 [Contarinia nasturtii]XP_031620604.1 uncharacterized protein LOC116339090 [Contarinia nasturtii]XP_031620605.1 uncharacterized protein LOC116339090 [Contarinia nasturtii]XP_031620606.1 uncharacterized protein LOC116339090 [Contarinia nasturtii]